VNGTRFYRSASDSLCHATSKRLLDALDDRPLGQIVEAEIFAPGTVRKVAAGIESVASEERLPLRTPTRGIGLVVWSRAESMTSMCTPSAPSCSATRCASMSGSSPKSEMLPRPSLISTISGYTLGFTQALGAHDAQTRDQPMGERCGPADGEALEALFREVDGRRRLEHHPRRAAGEDHERHLVATEIASRSSESTAPLVACIPLLRSIRRAPRRPTKTIRVPCAVADLLRRSWRSSGGPGPPCPRLVGTPGGPGVGRGSHGGVKRDVRWSSRSASPGRSGRACRSLGGALLAGRRPAAAIAGQRDLAHREDLALEECSALRRGHRLGWPARCPHLAGALTLLPAPESSGAGRPTREVCSAPPPASASWAISSKRSLARSAAAPAVGRPRPAGFACGGQARARQRGGVGRW